MATEGAAKALPKPLIDTGYIAILGAVAVASPKALLPGLKATAFDTPAGGVVGSGSLAPNPKALHG